MAIPQVAHDGLRGRFPPMLICNCDLCDSPPPPPFSSPVLVLCVQSSSRNNGGGEAPPRAESLVGNLVQQGICAKRRAPNVAQFDFAWHCGTPPYRGPHVPPHPRALPIRIDAPKLRGRRDGVLAGMAASRGKTGVQDSRRLRRIHPCQFRGATRLGFGDRRGCVRLGLFLRLAW